SPPQCVMLNGTIGYTSFVPGRQPSDSRTIRTMSQMSRGITSPQSSDNRDLYLSAIPNALNGTVSEPAWKVKPSWYLLTTEDKMIPPDAQRQMAKRADAMIVEVKGGHSIYVSQPQSVTTLVEKAAKGAPLVAAR